MIGKEVITRRQALRALGGVAPLAVIPLAQEQQPGQGDAVGTLSAPRMAGPGLERTTDWDNDPYLIGIENQLRCMCGCNQSVYQCRTTDFSCPLWPVTHRRLIGMVESGVEAQQIIDTFIAESGLEVLMAPPRSGFNLTAYMVPGFAIAAVGSALVWMLARRHRVAAAAVSAGAEPGSVDDRYQLNGDVEDAIKREMEKLDL